MKKTILALWNSNIVSNTNFIKDDKELKALSELMAHNMQKINLDLSDEKATYLSEYAVSVAEYCTKLTERAFEEGFSLATKLIIEALRESNT